MAVWGPLNPNACSAANFTMSSKRRRGEAMLLAAGGSLPSCPSQEQEDKAEEEQQADQPKIGRFFPSIGAPPAKRAKTSEQPPAPAAPAASPAKPGVTVKLPEKLQLLQRVFGELGLVDLVIWL